MNSRSEFNRCSLPRLTVKLGERELKEVTEKLKEEQRKEDRLEMIIGDWRRRAKKRQGEDPGDQPTNKRMRVHTDLPSWGHWGGHTNLPASAENRYDEMVEIAI